jgi:hypothetical protein
MSRLTSTERNKHAVYLHRSIRKFRERLLIHLEANNFSARRFVCTAFPSCRLQYLQLTSVIQREVGSSTTSTDRTISYFISEAYRGQTSSEQYLTLRCRGAFYFSGKKKYIVFNFRQSNIFDC